MIVCHSNRFIFVKPRKTAGTSVELAFSPLLSKGDLATLIEPDEEKIRKVANGVKVEQIKYKKYLLKRRLRDHSTLQQAVDCFGETILKYKIISMTRNPWDRAVSQFFWTMRKTDIKNRDFNFQKAEFNKFTQKWGRKTWVDNVYGRKRQRSANATSQYSPRGHVCVDFFIRYELLKDDCVKLSNSLSAGVIALPEKKIKSGHRKPGRHWADYYDDETKQLISHECSKEIELFGYEFSDSAPKHGPNFIREC